MITNLHTCPIFLPPSPLLGPGAPGMKEIVTPNLFPPGASTAHQPCVPGVHTLKRQSQKGEKNERTRDEVQPISEEGKTADWRDRKLMRSEGSQGNARNQKSPGLWEETEVDEECVQEAGGIVVCLLWSCSSLSTSMRGDSHGGTGTGHRRRR